MAAHYVDTFQLTGRGQPEQVEGARVTPEFFRTLAGAGLTGRHLTEDDRAVVIVSHRLWRRWFGEERLIEQSLVVNGEPALVVGIVHGAALPHHADLWWPLTSELDHPAAAHLHYLSVLGPLHPGSGWHEEGRLSDMPGPDSVIVRPDCRACACNAEAA